ncbi:MAG: M15 family metallopeptidase [Spirochaetaceae bacterium]|nr:M15 family metallopeptidase [Spirochaetaceae bacterium]
MLKKYTLLAVFLPFLLTFLSSNGRDLADRQNIYNDKILYYFAERGFNLSDLIQFNFTSANIENLLRLMAVRDGYPGLINYMSYQPQYNDWLLTFYNRQQLFFAGSRMLPLELLSETARFRPFISYQLREIDDPADFSAERINNLHARYNPHLVTPQPVTVAAPANPAPPAAPPPPRVSRSYNSNYYNIIYGGNTAQQIQRLLVRVDFLGYNFLTHPILAPVLEQIDEQIMAHPDEDEELTNFLASLTSIASYSFRPILGTTTLSYHAFAMAVDMLPRNQNQPIYWAWDARHNPLWYLTPVANRWQIPAIIIEAFEEHGFFWGGRWPMYDIMHFEYRPELLKLQQYRNEFNQFLLRLANYA